MATLYAADYGNKTSHMSAYGNGWCDDFQYTGSAKKDDKVYLGIVPAGVRVTGVRLLHHAAGTGVTADLGFEPADGDSPPASLTGFMNGTNIAASGVKDTWARPVTFNAPVKLVLTVRGADMTAGNLCAIVSGITLGAP